MNLNLKESIIFSISRNCSHPLPIKLVKARFQHSLARALYVYFSFVLRVFNRRSEVYKFWVVLLKTPDAGCSYFHDSLLNLFVIFVLFKPPHFCDQNTLLKLFQICKQLEFIMTFRHFVHLLSGTIRIPYRLGIYGLLNRTSSRMVWVTTASGLAQEFRILLPPKLSKN